MAFSQLKTKAKRLGVPFELSLEKFSDLIEIRVCDCCCGAIFGRPNIHRRELAKGYVESNIEVYCEYCMDKVSKEIGTATSKKTVIIISKQFIPMKVKNWKHRQCVSCSVSLSGLAINRNYCDECKQRHRRFENRRDIIKNRARAHGIPFDLNYFTIPRYIEWMTKPTHCRICQRMFSNEILERKRSIDRVIPEKGYVEGNILVICVRCNTIKSLGTAEDHIMIGEFLLKCRNTPFEPYLIAK